MAGTGLPGRAPQPGWALTGGRRKNVAIAASSVSPRRVGAGASGSRPRRPEEAAELAEYNRYLAELNADSSASSP